MDNHLWRAALARDAASRFERNRMLLSHGELSPFEFLEQQLIEKCLRQDLQPIEEAMGFAEWMKLNDWMGKDVAQALRVHPSRVSRALALLKLVQAMP